MTQSVDHIHNTLRQAKREKQAEGICAYQPKRDATERLFRNIEDDALMPPLTSRRTMLVPIRPSPIIPSCIAVSYFDFASCARAAATMLSGANPNFV